MKYLIKTASILAILTILAFLFLKIYMPLMQEEKSVKVNSGMQDIPAPCQKTNLSYSDTVAFQGKLKF